MIVYIVKLDCLVCEYNNKVFIMILFSPSVFSLRPSLSLSWSLVLECVELTEPGMTTLICSSRETLIGQPICTVTFIDLTEAVPCKR